MAHAGVVWSAGTFRGTSILVHVKAQITVCSPDGLAATKPFVAQHVKTNLRRLIGPEAAKQTKQESHSLPIKPPASLVVCLLHTGKQ